MKMHDVALGVALAFLFISPLCYSQQSTTFPTKHPQGTNQKEKDNKVTDEKIKDGTDVAKREQTEPNIPAPEEGKEDDKEKRTIEAVLRLEKSGLRKVAADKLVEKYVQNNNLETWHRLNEAERQALIQREIANGRVPQSILDAQRNANMEWQASIRDMNRFLDPDQTRAIAQQISTEASQVVDIMAKKANATMNQFLKELALDMTPYLSEANATAITLGLKGSGHWLERAFAGADAALGGVLPLTTIGKGAAFFYKGGLKMANKTAHAVDAASDLTIPLLKNRTTGNFWKSFSNLSPDIQKEARASFRLFQQNTNHPSVNFKALKNKKNLYSARVNQNFRALGTKKGDQVTWFWIGSHADYDKLISKYK